MSPFTKKFTHTQQCTVLKTHFDYTKVNGLLTQENIMGKIQEVYKEHFGSKRALKIRFTQKILKDIKEDEQQLDVIKNEHLRAHRGAEENKQQIIRRLLLPLIIQGGALQTKHDATIDLRHMGRQPILIFHQGEARLRLDYKYYIHHFNLTVIKTQVRSLREQFKNFSKNEFTELIIEKFSEIDFALKSIDPVRRHKRWDSLGTFWKFLAGNPDANDLMIINSSINDLITNNNEQVKINREVNLQLKEAIFQTKKAIELFNVGSVEMYCTRILFYLNYLSDKLAQIIDTIMLAKLGLVNEKILSQREIDILITDLARENITVQTAVEATNYAMTSVASNNLEIALIIKMPKLDPRVFNKVRLFPVIHENKQIHILHQFYLSHDEKIYQINTIEPTIFEIKDIRLDNTTCIPRLLKGESATCNYTSNPMEEEITFLDDQHIFINTMKNFTLTSNCGVTNRKLSGSFLISFNNCQLRINDVLYTSRVKTLPGNPIQLHLDGVEIKKQQDILNISVEHLHKLQTETRKDLDLIRLKNNSWHFLNWSIWSIIGGMISPLIICTLLLLSFLIYRNRTIKLNINNTTRNPNQAIEPEAVSLPIEEGRPNFRILTVRDSLNGTEAICEDEVIVYGHSFDDPKGVLNGSKFCDINGSRSIEFEGGSKIFVEDTEASGLVELIRDTGSFFFHGGVEEYSRLRSI
ncbi:uncharacterized protein LOC128745900 [Sabethes cyaneus]|uniref:uncharacterized protein LOC128745900 n=1 Tax=Sabethes cyaneus TaxID=53552 RepID=UPI00237EC245|nr:uncharacterized protein LOC128745900 [Sabethes cyaneus]